MSETVVVLGASAAPGRISRQGLRLLTEYGHQVIPVHPAGGVLDGLTVLPNLASIDVPVDTVSVYLRPGLCEPLVNEIIALAPKRVVFNPGSESPRLREQLEAAGIRVQWECTLILLRADRWAA